MIAKFILEDGVTLSKYKRGETLAKLKEKYETKGAVSLPEGLIVRSIQGLPAEHDEYTVVIIIGKLQ